MKKSSRFIDVAASACIFACFGEFLTLFVFGRYYHGYNQLHDTMSALGSSESPVSFEISLWWTLMGIIMIFFGTGFKKLFAEKGIYASFASLLIILYGLGEGIGSGVFKSDHIQNSLTTSGIIHDIFGGTGVTAILLLPVIIRKVIPRNEMPGLYRMSAIVFITGIITILLFLLRYVSDYDNFLTINKGLWQRLWMLNTYVYLTTIAIIMLRKNRPGFQSAQ